jgi:dTDP-N-acetylfucosamine:lipid II N-acetylfucosaminyltransferase
MKIHIFNNENQYAVSYLKFLEKNFDISSNLIVFKKSSDSAIDYSDKLKERIIYAKSNLQLFYRILPDLRRSSKIILHHLPHGPALILWSLFPGFLSKTTWVIWGADLYMYRQAKKSLSSRFYEVFRKYIISHIPHIASFIPGDFEQARKIYNTGADYFQSMYPLPVDFLHFLRPDKAEPMTGGFKILAGNSGNPSNLHLELLSKLEPLKGSDIKIFCPLSYSGDPEYINSVMVKGKEIFGDKFIPITELLDPERYLNMLYDINIAIMNHERQQGLGNILPLLFFGKKVYLRSGTSSFEYLKSIGCRLHDLSSFNTFDESLLTPEQDEPENNSRIIGALLSEKRCRDLWERILN